MTTRTRCSALSVVALALAGTAVAQNTLTKDTPFVSKSAQAAEVPAESIEFAGVITGVGKKKMDLIFFDKTAKKTRWVPLGETVEGITALNYDERLDQAVIKVNGVQKTLTMRKGSSPANAPAPVATMQSGFNAPAPIAMPPVASMPVPATPQPMVPAPANAAAAPAVAPAPTPATPQDAQTRQETEARMLVSDLLEIGMAQRKAYEEAQRKQQGGNPPAAPAPAPTPPPAK